MPQTTLIEPLSAPARGPRRHFIGWDRHALRTTAALLAQDYARGGEIRLEDVTVVLSSSRATRHLKAHLLDEAETRGTRLLPPRVITVGSLPELLYRTERPEASDAMSHRLWTRAIRQLAPERVKELFLRPPTATDVLGWSRLARGIAALHLQVSGAGLRFAEVAGRTDEALLFADTLRWDILADVQSTYESELARFDRSDRELARIDVLARGDVSMTGDVWLVGVIEMPRVLVRMLAAAPETADRLTVVVQAPESDAADFDALGCLEVERWAARTVPLRDAQLTVRDRPADQAREVGRFLASLDGAYAADEILVAAPDETLISYLEQGLGEAGVATRAAAGLPLDRTPVFRLLAAVADFLDGHRFPAAAALVRHPELGRWLREGRAGGPRGRARRGLDAWLEPLDRYFTDHLPGRLHRPPVDSTDGTARRVGDLVDALMDDRLLGRFRGQRHVGEWMTEVIGLLVEVYGRDELDISIPANRRVLETCQHLRTAAFELIGLPEPLAERSDAATAIRLLLEEVSALSLPADPDRDAIELLGWLELRLDDAPVAVVTTFNESILPESVNAHPWLPNTLRERIGLVGNSARYARDVYELTALLHTREQVCMISGRHTAVGDPLRPSRLAFAVEGPALARRVEQFYLMDTGDPDEESGVGPEHGEAVRPSAGDGDRDGLARPHAGYRERGDVAGGAAGVESRGDRAVADGDEGVGSTLDPAVADGDEGVGSPLDPAVAGGDEGVGSTMDPAAAGAGSGRRMPVRPRSQDAFRLPPEPVLRAPEPLAKLRVTDFRQLMADPYSFFLERVLRLERLDDRARELDGLGFGSLAHAVLEQFARTAEVRAVDEAVIRARLDAILDRIASARFGADALPAVRVQIEQLRTRLHGFARWQAGWIADGWRVVGVECATPSDGVPFEVDHLPFRLSGRIDRIDHHPERGEWVLFDYKTGDAGDDPEKAHRTGARDEKKWIDLQLPLYRHLLPHLPDLQAMGMTELPAEEDLRLGYITLSRDLASAGAQLAAWTPAELAEADGCARDIIRFVRSNEYRFDRAGGSSIPRPPLSDLFSVGYLQRAVDDDKDEEETP